MPWSCYSYLADVPASTPNRGAVPSAPPGRREMPYPCYSYPFMCFSYPGEVPPGGGHPGAARLPLSGLRRMPMTCFRY
jgi:hypothetical protein